MVLQLNRVQRKMDFVTPIDTPSSQANPAPERHRATRAAKNRLKS